MRRLGAIGLALAMALGLGGCVAAGRLAREEAAAPVFDPARFFAGETRGEGVLSVAFSGARPVRVASRGVTAADGSIVLDQTVREGDRPARQRQWRLRPAGSGRWTGTLSDASGPVAGEVAGNRLHLRFRMTGGLDAEQWLYLRPGGREVLNRMVVRKLGVPVASLTETIRKP